LRPAAESDPYQRLLAIARKDSLVSLKARQLTIVASSFSLMLTLSVSAQPPGTSEQPGLPQHGATMRSMSEMMKQCRTHHQELSEAVDRTLLIIADAQRSKAPDKMEASLEHSSSSLSKI
jgi:RNA polymerase subunit RPABC4/transcription elongation factor Spt4